MSLREVAARDFARFTSNLNEFGHRFTVTSPDGTVYSDIRGLSQDIGASIDPDTGMLVAGRTSSVSVNMQQFRDRGVTDIPKLVLDDSEKPWRFEWHAVDGNTYLFAIRQAIPDRSIDQTVLIIHKWGG